MEQKKNRIVLFIFLIILNLPITGWSNFIVNSNDSTGVILEITINEINCKNKTFSINIEIINQNDSIIKIPDSLDFDPKLRLNSYFIDVQIQNEKTNLLESLPLTNIVTNNFVSNGIILGHNKLIIKENLFFRYNKLIESMNSDGILISAKINLIIQLNGTSQLISLESNEIKLNFSK